MRVLVVMLTVIYTANVYADWIIDKYIDDSERFFVAKPEIKEWGKNEKVLADAWERTIGLSKLIDLKSLNELPLKQVRALNRRLRKLRELPRIIMQNATPEGEQLKAMIRLFSKLTDLHLSGVVKYSTFALVNDYIEGYGKIYAEKLRGKNYKEKKACKWLDKNCQSLPALEYWEQ